MIINLLSFFATITNFVSSVFNFLVEKTGSTAMAYLSLGLVALLAIALVVFLILAIVGSCKRRKAKKSAKCDNDKNSHKQTATEEVSTENTTKETVKEPSCESLNEETIDEAIVADADGEQTANPSDIQPTANKSEEAPVKKQPKVIYDDGIPAMPIYRKSKYEKPKTILVKKDKSKLRNPINDEK